MLRQPPNGDPYLTEIIGILNAELIRKEAMIIGYRHDGTNLHLRFRASISTPWVQVHVQSVATGGTTYSPTTFVSSTEVDCRSNRVQDVIVVDLPADRYIVWLIGVQYDAAATKVLYDGQAGRPDNMSFATIGL